nr:PREDICTED: C-type lectin domain family 4 member A-like [Opisthocomus hoazin]
MASEITYAEVKFKNTSPAAAVEVPPETKKHEHRPQKYPLWLPWLISLLLLLVCIAFVIALLAFTLWSLPAQGKAGRAARRNVFQKSCYYLSADLMPLAESEQNCTGMGSHLAVITSEAEQAQKQLHLASRKNPLEMSSLACPPFWRRGEPSNLTDEMCVVIHMVSTMYNWNDVPCKEHYRICEATAVTV